MGCGEKALGPCSEGRFLSVGKELTKAVSLLHKNLTFGELLSSVSLETNKDGMCQLGSQATCPLSKTDPSRPARGRAGSGARLRVPRKGSVESHK